MQTITKFRYAVGRCTDKISEVCWARNEGVVVDDFGCQSLQFTLPLAFHL